MNAEQLFFTSGGTESDQIPLLSLLKREGRGRIIVSAIEHSAIVEQCKNLSKCGFEVVFVNPDKNGFVKPSFIEEKLTSDTLLVAVMAVNNETGCIQPVYEIADMIVEKSRGGRKPHFHVDAVQAAGKIPLDVSHQGIDSAAFSSHKISGPRGIGLLYLANPGKFQPFLVGGGQEKSVRSGTENLFGAVAFSKCLEKYFLPGGTVDSKKMERFNLQKKWTSDFIKSISEIKNCVLVPEIRSAVDEETQAKFSPWIVQAAFEGIPGQVMVRALDSKGFCISTGSACSLKKQSRPVLAAMNAGPKIQESAVRFSFGPLTTEAEMNALFEAVKSVCLEFGAVRPIFSVASGLPPKVPNIP